MDDYRKALKKLAEEKSTDFINNSSTEHAAAMIEELFRHASGKVYILSDHLKPDVYAKIAFSDSVQGFLDKEDSEIIIALQLNDQAYTDNYEDALRKNSFVSTLMQKKPDSVKIYRADKRSKLGSLQNHFFVTQTDVGNFAFRFETDLVSHRAIGTFNGGEDGKKLYDYFDQNIKEKDISLINLN